MSVSETPRKRINRKQILRKIFVSVMETSNQIKATTGNAGAIKYQKAFEGKPLYKNDVSFLKYIDYYVDVEKAALDTLSEWQLTMFRAGYLDKQVFPDVLSVAHLRMQELLAQVFIDRRLYPVSRYFKGGTA